MPNVFIEENGVYQIDCTAALWATNEINVHYSHIPLNDVDFVIEDETNLYLLEYKNANIPGASAPEAFHPLNDKPRLSVIHKFYDSLHYLTLLNKTKGKVFIYVVEGRNVDSVMRNRLKNTMKKELPFDLQSRLSGEIRLIDGLDVLSIDEWNTHSVYGKYPISKVVG